MTYVVCSGVEERNDPGVPPLEHATVNTVLRFLGEEFDSATFISELLSTDFFLLLLFSYSSISHILKEILLNFWLNILHFDLGAGGAFS